MMLTIHHIVTFPESPEETAREERRDAQLVSIAARLEALKMQNQAIMATIADILSDVKAEKELLAGLSTFIQGLKDQLAEALKPSPEQQAALDEVFADVEANKAAIVAAANVNTPHATPNDVAASAHIEGEAATPPAEPAPVELPVANP